MANFFSRGRRSEQQQRLKSRGVAPRKCLASLPYNSRRGEEKASDPFLSKLRTLKAEEQNI